MSISIHKGSILDSTADYIVNPANSFLRHGGGLAAVIDAAATRPFDVYPLEQYTTDPGGSPVALIKKAEEVHRAKVLRYAEDHMAAPLVATGNCHMTSAGALPYKGIIHAVGPIWNGGGYCEGLLLRKTYGSLFFARQHHSIAIPAISCGIFGLPIYIGAHTALEVAQMFDDEDGEIEFWVFSDEHYKAYKESAEDLEIDA